MPSSPGELKHKKPHGHKRHQSTENTTERVTTVIEKSESLTPSQHLNRSLNSHRDTKKESRSKAIVPPPNARTQPTPSPRPSVSHFLSTKVAKGGRSSNFALDAANWVFGNNPYDALLDARDVYWVETLVGVAPEKLHDLAGIFLKSQNVYADEKDLWGPPKWNYNAEDPLDSFDVYARFGCPNCGHHIPLEQEVDMEFSKRGWATLLCPTCGHRPCPMHYDNESESLMDRLADEAGKAAGDLPEGEKSAFPGAVYLRGTRRLHDFGQNDKQWWQQYYLPKAYRDQAASATLAVSELLGDSKGEKVKEVCEVCGHDEAFFATYQARSADEGLTIMYECTRCHSRKTFNN